MENNKNKYSKWVFTLLEGGEFNSLPSSMEMGEALEKVSDKFVFQREICPSTGRKHFQGCFITRIRKRHATILNELAVDLQAEVNQLTVDRMQGSWDQSVLYCSKTDSREDDTKVFYSKDMREEIELKYKGNDLRIFNESGFRPWQQEIFNIIFEDEHFTIKNSNSRSVYWIGDTTGNTGKSLFTKYLCYNSNQITKVAFGSGSQMRSSIVEEGAKKCYIIDIPRQLCNDDHLNNIYSVIEDCKNGFVKSSMYGKSKTLFMEPPIVIILANFDCPVEKLSVDRWEILSIVGDGLISLADERLLD